MKLISPEIQQRFAEVGNQNEVENPLILAKFFSPIGGATWYATEYDPETNICFGYVKDLIPSATGMFDEWGCFSVTELESITLPLGLKIERDLHFDEITFKEQFPPKIKKRAVELQKIKEKKEPHQEIEH